MNIIWYHPFKKRVLAKYEFKLLDCEMGGFINYYDHLKMSFKLVVCNFGFWVTI